MSYVVLLAELLAEGGAHDDTALVRGRLEVSGAALAARRRNGCACHVSKHIPPSQFFPSFSSKVETQGGRDKNVQLLNFILAG